MKWATLGKKRFWVIFIPLAAAFVWDLNVPNGLADWVWYFIPVYMTAFVSTRLFSYLVAVLITSLILIGYHLSPVGLDSQLCLTGRLIGIAAIWLMAVIIGHYKDVAKQRSRIERALRTITECNRIQVRATCERELLDGVCRVLVEQGGYRMSWVGFAQNDEQKSVQVAACSGSEDGYLEKAKITWSDQSTYGRGQTGLAIRTGKTVVSNDFQNDECTQPWWDEGKKRGYLAAITIPLISNTRNFGVFVLYAGKRNAFSPDEVELLGGLADDLAYGIGAMRAEVEKRANERAKEEGQLRLQLSAQATGLGIWDWNLVNNEIHWDLQMFRIYGLTPTPDSLMDYSFWRAAVLPEDLAYREAQFQSTIQTGATSRFCFRIRRVNDGSCRHLEAVVIARKNTSEKAEWLMGTILDITERKLAADALLASENQLQFLISQTPAIIYSLRTTPEIVTTFISPNIEKILGYPPDMCIQDASFWFKRLHPEDAAEAVKKFPADGSGIVSREYRFRHADGSYRWMRDEACAINNGQHQPTEYVGHWFDITDRKRAEAEIIKARDFYLRLLENAPALIWRAGTDAKCDWFNQTWLAFTGRTMTQESGDGWVEGVHPEDLARCMKDYTDAFRKREPFVIEYRLRHHDGSYRWILDFGRPMDSLSGEFAGYIGFCYDITERKQAESALIKREEIFSTIVNQAGDAIGLVDPETMRFVEFNTAAHEMLGYTRKEFTGFGPADIEGQLTPEQVQQNLKLIVECGGAVFETKHRHHNGELRDIRVNTRGINIQGKDYITAIWSDITSSRKREIELRNLTLAVEQNPVSIIITDPQGNIEYVNRRFTEVTGYTQGEVLGQNPRILKSGQQSASVYEELWRKITAGCEWRGELINRKKDGSLHCEFVVIAPVKNAQAVTTHFVAMKEDITAAKKVAADLEIQRRFLVDLVENSMLQISVKDREGRYLMVNRSFESISRRKREAIIGRTPLEIFGEMDGRQSRENDLAVMSSGQSRMFEEEMTDEDGQKRFFISSKFPVRNERDEITGIASMALEITDRIQSEAQAMRLAKAVEQSGESIVITDTNGVILYANPTFEKTTGYTLAEAVGRTPRLLKSDKQDARFYREMWNTLLRGGIWKGHLINMRKDGTLYEEDASISPIRDKHGKIVNYVASKRDVTREVQLEAQFRQAQKMEAMGTLAGGIAHDFNNILSVIFGYGYILQLETEKNKELHEKVLEILLAANRAKDLVKQILTFSRQNEQKREIIRLASVIKEATKFLRASVPANIQIRMELAEDAPAVLADPTQIYQVVLNLATNAMHAMEHRQGSLTIQLESFTPDENLLATNASFRRIPYTVLTIADTGHGMDAKTLERIFEPFFTTKPVGKGTGLGLAVVHGIIHSHDGIITVESQVGRGTTFCLYFPAQSEDQIFTDAATLDLPRGKDQKILVVDDEIMVTGMFQKMLKLLNYKPTVCNYPREALAIVQKNPDDYDLIITDLTMPDMNGLDFAREVHLHYPDLPIILMSGFISTMPRENLEQAGIIQTFTKPIAMNDLAKALKKICPQISNNSAP